MQTTKFIVELWPKQFDFSEISDFNSDCGDLPHTRVLRSGLP